MPVVRAVLGHDGSLVVVGDVLGLAVRLVEQYGRADSAGARHARGDTTVVGHREGFVIALAEVAMLHLFRSVHGLLLGVEPFVDSFPIVDGVSALVRQHAHCLNERDRRRFTDIRIGHERDSRLRLEGSVGAVTVVRAVPDGGHVDGDRAEQLAGTAADLQPDRGHQAFVGPAPGKACALSEQFGFGFAEQRQVPRDSWIVEDQDEAGSLLPVRALLGGHGESALCERASSGVLGGPDQRQQGLARSPGRAWRSSPRPGAFPGR